MYSSEWPLTTLTVLMPISSVDAFLAKAIDSLKRQTYGEFKCLILVPCLEGAESDKLKQLIAGDERFEVHHLWLSGIAFALNYGLNLVRSKYVARMDGDDISLPERFEQQIKFLEAFPEYGVVGCRVSLIDAGGAIIRRPFKFYEDNKSIRRALKYRMPLCHPALIFRSDVLFKNKGYLYGHSAEDHELFLRIARDESCLLKNLPETLFLYRRHNSQLTNMRFARIAYNNIAGFMFTEFLSTLNFLYLITIVANHPFIRSLRNKFKDA